jgi:hypothetical protein
MSWASAVASADGCDRSCRDVLQRIDKDGVSGFEIADALLETSLRRGADIEWTSGGFTFYRGRVTHKVIPLGGVDSSRVRFQERHHALCGHPVQPGHSYERQAFWDALSRLPPQQRRFRQANRHQRPQLHDGRT